MFYATKSVTFSKIELVYDCTVAMTEYLAGSEEAFVERMKQRAKEFGMNDTCFKNCHGIDTDGHVTSSYDIALMSRIRI